MSSMYETTVVHHNEELKEKLTLGSFKHLGQWFVNVTSEHSGVAGYSVVAVPLSVFQKLIDGCKADDVLTSIREEKKL